MIRSAVVAILLAIFAKNLTSSLQFRSIVRGVYFPWSNSKLSLLTLSKLVSHKESLFLIYTHKDGSNSFKFQLFLLRKEAFYA